MQEKTTNHHHHTPFIAIIGRPNVGKSTLFNRLVGRKIAITDSIPGSTRDIIERTISFGDMTVSIADTGGRRERADSDLETLAIKKSYSVDERADLLLFVVEAHQFLPEDEQLISYLRQYQKKVILVVNKCDSHDRDHIASNYHSLGFSPLIMISAEHGRNIDTLKELLQQHLEPVFKANVDTMIDTDDNPQQKPIRLTILGKPNAGKSSLANHLCNNDKSIVSAEAGTTRDSVKNHFTYNNQPYEIIDTAGLRRRSKVNDPIEFYSTRRAEASITEADVVILMIDATEGLTDQDKKIADKIMKEQKPFLFVLSKCDLLSKEDFPRGKDPVKESIADLHEDFPILNYIPAVGIDVIKGNGLSKFMQMVQTLYHQNRKKIDDTEFQRALIHWRHDLQASTTYQKSTIRSIRQVATEPPRFIVRTQGKVPKTYVRYLKNRIQKEFEFHLVPIIVEVEGV
ncbi:ribosome biogenesis GTPase Der [Entomospira entomophila]|uniref:GTPase Der n=1 Tax=Entomospira entomophila TaxID=2719988 RepID=A0A968G8R3_9SPIO|nr:ribosome biogenesis GTPase Der [Entomospira entomophilus]NIZ39910.1 ribosome biogenesis GTPase Der [Entomospira entomophilus]WDI35472.1 ribosome biogenesis GTPase Der [Entomospira entomophilus]